MSDVMYYWYDQNRRKYVECEGTMELGPVYVSPARKSLEDVGTRFNHVNDLYDWLGDGLVAVTNSITRYNNEQDVVRKKKLEDCLLYLGIYRDQMAGIDGHQYAFNDMLDRCIPEPGVLAAIRKERIEAAKNNPQKDVPPAIRPEDDPNLQGTQ